MRWVWVGLFVALLAEAVFLSPPQRPDQDAWVWALLTGDWAGQEPLVVAQFQLMGMWPVAVASVLAPRLRRRPVPLWPFALASMAVGAFAVLPGLALGGEPVAWSGSRWLRHPVLLGAVGLGAVALAVWGLAAGSPSAWWEAFRTEQFVHVMTLDFLALWLITVLAARQEGGTWAWTLVPLVGALCWAWLRRDA